MLRINAKKIGIMRKQNGWKVDVLFGKFRISNFYFKIFL